MAWSNIFCQIISASGPVIGEGQLSGWQTSIELTGFDWKLSVDKKAPIAGNALDKLKKAALTALPVRPFDQHSVSDRGITLKKRFDIASSHIHQLMDYQIPILSVSITVLHISPSGQTFHRPGFVALCTDCRIKKVDVGMKRGNLGVDVEETVEVEYGQITLTYLRSIPGPTGREPLPMPPFIYAKAKPKAASGLPI